MNGIPNLSSVPIHSIIQSSVEAEFEAFMEGWPYTRLPPGHPVYSYPLLQPIVPPALQVLNRWLRGPRQ